MKRVAGFALAALLLTGTAALAEDPIATTPDSDKSIPSSPGAEGAPPPEADAGKTDLPSGPPTGEKSGTSSVDPKAGG